MFAKILGTIVIIGLIAFSTYQIVLFVKDLMKRKKAKSDKKGDSDLNQ